MQEAGYLPPLFSATLLKERTFSLTRSRTWLWCRLPLFLWRIPRGGHRTGIWKWVIWNQIFGTNLWVYRIFTMLWDLKSNTPFSGCSLRCIQPWLLKHWSRMLWWVVDWVVVNARHESTCFKSKHSHWCTQGENPEVRQARRLALVNAGIIPTLVQVSLDPTGCLLYSIWNKAEAGDEAYVGTWRGIIRLREWG